MPRVWFLTMGSLILAAGLGAPPPARGDLIPESVAECLRKSVGAACAGGVCRARSCSWLDYEHPDPDRDGGPSIVSYDCLMCEPATRDAGGGPDTGVVTRSSVGGGGCSAAGSNDFGARVAALAFALCTGLWLGGYLRRPRR